MLDLEASKTALNLTALLTTPEISQLNEAIKEKGNLLPKQDNVLQAYNWKTLNNSLFTKHSATQSLHTLWNIYSIPPPQVQWTKHTCGTATQVNKENVL